MHLLNNESQSKVCLSGEVDREVKCHLARNTRQIEHGKKKKNRMQTQTHTTHTHKHT